MVATGRRWLRSNGDPRWCVDELVECVPNVSEGRDRSVIDAVTAVVEEVEGVRLLDVAPGADTNRTVITFIGPSEGVAEAAFRVVRRPAS
jgi:glutamate formiminotransferase / formiminotetrahydrofolate cyclodeaminase